MLRDLAPLFVYMRRYRWGFFWGTLSCVCTNIVWVQFPGVLGKAINSIEKVEEWKVIGNGNGNGNSSPRSPGYQNGVSTNNASPRENGKTNI